MKYVTWLVYIDFLQKKVLRIIMKNTFWTGSSDMSPKSGLYRQCYLQITRFLNILATHLPGLLSIEPDGTGLGLTITSMDESTKTMEIQSYKRMQSDQLLLAPLAAIDR